MNVLAASPPTAKDGLRPFAFSGMGQIRAQLLLHSLHYLVILLTATEASDREAALREREADYS